jgi:hypothetical protein
VPDAEKLLSQVKNLPIKAKFTVAAAVVKIPVKLLMFASSAKESKLLL